MIEARVVRSIEVIIHEHISPLPDLPAIRPRPARSVKRLREREGEAKLDYCGVIDRCLNSTPTGRLQNITYQRELDGRGAEIQQLICRPREHQSIWIVWENARSGSIVTFWRRTAVLVPQRSLGSSRFLVSSAMLKFRQREKAAITPAETKSSLCHHAFVGEIRCDPQSYGESLSR
jgi:hypothetical protein